MRKSVKLRLRIHCFSDYRLSKKFCMNQVLIRRIFKIQQKKYRARARKIQQKLNMLGKKMNRLRAGESIQSKQPPIDEGKDRLRGRGFPDDADAVTSTFQVRI